MNQVGLWLVKEQTIGSTVSSVAVTDAFNADYDNYFITINGGSSSVSNMEIRLQLGASTTGYYSQLIFAAYAGALSTPAFVNNFTRFGWAAHSQGNSLTAAITLMSPNLAVFTRISNPWHTQTEAGFASGIHQVATAYTGFTLLPQSGTLTGGTIRIYGYKVL
jgi:hypothetical protein